MLGKISGSLKVGFRICSSSIKSHVFNQFQYNPVRSVSLPEKINAINQYRYYSPLYHNENPQKKRHNRRPIRQQYEQPSVIYPSSKTTYYNNGNEIVKPSDRLYDLLSRPVLILQRNLEMMNIMFGFEQANQYILMDGNGTHLGYLREEDFGIGKVIMRQITKLHRPFKVELTDTEGNLLMVIKRPFSFINSHIQSILPSNIIVENSKIGESWSKDRIIGESVQSWHLWRRRYNLFKNISDENFEQFGIVDAPFLSFSFPINDENGLIIGAVDRNWVGFGRELFTDTGVYILRMEPEALETDEYRGLINNNPQGLDIDQRAILLSTAVSIDFDYFSRHSRSGSGGLFPFYSYDSYNE